MAALPSQCGQAEGSRPADAQELSLEPCLGGNMRAAGGDAVAEHAQVPSRPQHLQSTATHPCGDFHRALEGLRVASSGFVSKHQGRRRR